MKAMNIIHPETFKEADFQGAKGMVFIGEKIIVYRRDGMVKNYPNTIDLPGGGREDNESPFETFKREVMEEFGLSIKETDICASFRQDSALYPGKKSFFFVTKPLAYTEKDVVFGYEGVGWMLMSPEEFATAPDGVPMQQKRVQGYLTGKIVSE